MYCMPVPAARSLLDVLGFGYTHGLACGVQVQVGLCRPAESDVAAETHNIYQRLILLDPMRAGYYADARDGKADELLTAAAH